MRGKGPSLCGHDAEMNKLAFGWCTGAVMVLVFEPTACAILTIMYPGKSTMLCDNVPPCLLGASNVQMRERAANSMAAVCSASGGKAGAGSSWRLRRAHKGI